MLQGWGDASRNNSLSLFRCPCGRKEGGSEGSAQVEGGSSINPLLVPSAWQLFVQTVGLTH